MLAAIDDALVERIAGRCPGQAASFEDQYISSAGQLYELMMGHDRWMADIRPLVWASRGQPGLCCHPYDLCTTLIARAAGVVVTNARGEALDAPFEVDADVAWAGYANRAIQALVEPVLQDLLLEYGLTPNSTTKVTKDTKGLFEHLCNGGVIHFLYGPPARWLVRAFGAAESRARARGRPRSGRHATTRLMVLQLPLARRRMRRRSGRPRTHRWRARTTMPHGAGADVDATRRSFRRLRHSARFAADPSRRWARNALGAITVLHHQRGVRFDRGVQAATSEVPLGKGVSSSAAIEARR
jgi:hypothetical protein